MTFTLNPVGVHCGQTAQVPKQGRNLRRESAYYAVLMAQVSTLKWNLRRLRLNLSNNLRLYIAVTGSGLHGIDENR